MSQTKTVTPEEAQALMKQGYSYIDVRNEIEFEQGHPAGAYNVPLTQMTDFGPEPNDSFIEVMNHHFGPSAKLVIGCSTGVTSLRAADMLDKAGYTNIVDYQAGMNGYRDAFGRKSPGWLDCGLPVEYGQPEQRSFEALAEPIRK
jgi:rhodanese-related sulfurtransferase